MNCTKNIHKDNSALATSDVVEAPHFAESNNSSFALGTLTNYNRDVDIKSKSLDIVHYGLRAIDLFLEEEKLKKQKQFLKTAVLYDRINQNAIPLADIYISANHSPHRYYSEVQNRVNTLSKIAKERGLVPVYMTITLPSEYHPQKQIVFGKNKGTLVVNPKYNGCTPQESVKVLTKMFTKLRHDRSLKDDLTKENRLYFRVNEPTKSGTPHTHILMFIPANRVDRVKKAFKRLFDLKANDIQTDIKDATAYVMKYINKTLPLSKADTLSKKEKYLNAWYTKNRIIRFHSSRSLAPLAIYRLLHKRYTLFALTRLLNEKHFSIYVEVDSDKVMEIIDEWGDIVYERGTNYNVYLRGSYFPNNSQTSDSAIGVLA
jgi:hypothetical protein